MTSPPSRRRAINAVIFGIALGLGTTAIDALFGLDAVPWPLSIVLSALLGGGAFYAASGRQPESEADQRWAHRNRE